VWNVSGINKKKLQDWFWAYLMILPTLAGTLIFSIWPLIQSFYLAFTKWGAFGSYEWGGTVNFERMLGDTVLWQSLRNTIVYTVGSVPAGIALSIVVAALLNTKIRGMSTYRTLYFLPVVTMPVAVAMVWRWLYNADFGLLNHMLRSVGIEGPRWLTDPKYAMLSLIIVSVWSSIGYNMVIFLSGLQGISKQYYEAADIDGASAFVQFFRITLPLLTPTIFFVTVTSLISAFQVFELIFTMIGINSPVIRHTQSIVFYFYRQAFVNMDKGYASAIALLLFAIIMAVTIVQFRLQRRWVHYE